MVFKLQVLTFLLLATVATCAKADDTALKTALFDLAPWTKIDGQPSQGIIPLLNAELVKELEQPVEIVTVPYARMVHLLESGDIDFAIFFQSTASNQIADPLTVFYTMRTSIVGLDVARQPAPAKLRVAHPRGVVFGSNFETDDRYEKLATNSHEHSVSLLLSGRVDGVAGPENLIRQMIDAAAPQKAHDVLSIINVNEVTLQFSKRSAKRESMQRLQEAAERLLKNGKVKELLSQFPYN